MFTNSKKNREIKETVKQKSEQELSDAELAKVAGGVPPHAGQSGAEI